MIHAVPLLSEHQTEKNGLEILQPCIFMPDAEAARVTPERGAFSHFFKKFLQTSNFDKRSLL